ncbi:MAG: hypothetical protein R2751_07225 [Bacteroidales bacterium]
MTYSARNNLIYYEAYKDFLERLLDDRTLQGWRFTANYRPLPVLYLGVRADYRFRTGDPVPSKNLHATATLTRVPRIEGILRADFTWMKSAYLDGLIYGGGYERDLLSGRLAVGIDYHYVDYLYRSSETDLARHVGEVSLSWNLVKKLFLATHYEMTLDDGTDFHRIHLTLTQRF